MRNIQYRFIVVAVLCSIILGCQKSEKNVDVGDRFEVAEDFWYKGTLRSTEDDDESFMCILPKGAVLKATEKSDVHKEFFSAEPIRIDNESDQVVIENRLVPQNIRSRSDYGGYYFSLQKDLLGTKLKRLEQ